MTEQLNPAFWQALTPYLNSLDFSYLAEAPTPGPQVRKESKTMITQLHTPKLQLSGLVTPAGVLRFAFRGETITEALADYTLEELLELMRPWQATFESGESQTIYTGPVIERAELLAILPNCKTLEKAA